VFGFGIVYGPDISALLFGDRMLLTTLNPKFRDKEGADTDDYNAAIAIEFDCPGCAGTKHSHRIWAPFEGRYDGPGPKWTATGSGYNDLTFNDTDKGSRSIRYLSGCKSHFNVTSGAIDFYGDSGHTQWSQKMNETAKDTAASTGAPTAEAETAPAADPTAGYVRTMQLKFVDGRLQQKWEAFHIGGVPQEKWIEVASENTEKPAADPDQNPAA
jgi:hypothetical protein